MIVVVVIFTWGLAFASSSAAAAEGAPPTAAQFRSARTEFTDAEAAFWQAREKLADPEQDDPASDRLREALLAKRKAVFAMATEIANADPASDAGFEALQWLLLQAPWLYGQPGGPSALELMTKHYAADPRVGPGVARVAYLPPFGTPHDLAEPEPGYPQAIALLKAVAANNTDRAARGQAMMGLAWQAKRAFVYASYKGNPQAAEYRAEAERALESVVRDYDDCLYLGMNKGKPSKSTLGKLARAELFELRNLQPGKPAPEIEAEDLDGVKFKLSDYRGRVVLLVFWGGWCSPCMAAVPHERDLATRFAARPFAVVGVNSDEERATALRAAAKHQVTWRSFWNGADGSAGPISSAWNVRSWPTVYVIDHRGVIRHTLLDGDELDAPLEKLVAEAEAEKPR
jgi:peroxiredoxin